MEEKGSEDIKTEREKGMKNYLEGTDRKIFRGDAAPHPRGHAAAMGDSGPSPKGANGRALWNPGRTGTPRDPRDRTRLRLFHALRHPVLNCVWQDVHVLPKRPLGGTSLFHGPIARWAEPGERNGPASSQATMPWPPGVGGQACHGVAAVGHEAGPPRDGFSMSSGKGQGSMWGTIIGGILGAIVGALTYGTGAYAGYAAGFAIGSAIGGVVGYLVDPPAMAPDSQAVGQAATQDLMGTTAQDGVPVPDLVGITKCGGNLMGYWRNRTVETTETYPGGGGKGGGDSEKVTQITGHEYYLTWAMGLCLGPVDDLLAIYRKEVCIWHGLLSRPETGGFRTLVIEDVGRINFYYGTDDQPRDTRLNEMVGEANNPAYRGLCYVVFVDCLMGNYNRLPEFWFVIRKRPEYAWSALGEIYENYNPAHSLYYTLTEMAGVDTSLINESAFAAAAETLSDEGRGLSCYFDRQTSAGSYVDTILTHMRGLLRYGPDGLFHLVLIRRDTSGTVPVLDADELASGLKLTRPSAVEVKNEIKVQFTRMVYEKGVDLWSRGYKEPGLFEYYPAVPEYNLGHGGRDLGQTIRTHQCHL